MSSLYIYLVGTYHIIIISFFSLFLNFKFEPHYILKSQYWLWWLSQRLFFWVSLHLGFLNFCPKLHKDSNFLKHRLLLLSFTTLLLLIFFSLFICYSYPSLSYFSSFGLLDQHSWSFLHLLWCQLLDGGG